LFADRRFFPSKKDSSRCLPARLSAKPVQYGGKSWPNSGAIKMKKGVDPAAHASMIYGIRRCALRYFAAGRNTCGAARNSTPGSSVATRTRSKRPCGPPLPAKLNYICIPAGRHVSPDLKRRGRRYGPTPAGVTIAAGRLGEISDIDRVLERNSFFVADQGSSTL